MSDDFSFLIKSFSSDTAIDFSAFSKEEEAHILSARHPLLRSQRTHAILAAKEMTGDPTLEVAHDKTGRPFLRHPDGRRDSRDLSISHKQNQLLVGLVQSPNRIGVDLEEVDPKRDYQALRKYALAEGEEAFMRAHFVDCLGMNSEAAFSAIWAIKEAFIKATDTVSLDPRWIRIGLDSSGRSLVIEKLGEGKVWEQTQTREISFRVQGCTIAAVVVI